MKLPKNWKEYEELVEKLEEEGMTTSDAQGVVDAFLLKNGISPITLKKAKELIPDGNAADQPDSDFDPKQLAMGVKVELEHTKNKALAKEIAKDHLAEIPDYYTKLIKMEREAAYPMAPEPEKINLKERWDNEEWNKLDGAPEEEVLTQPLRSRKDYGESMKVSKELRKIASSLKNAGWGAVMIMGEHGVAVAEKGGKIFTAPLDHNHSFEFNDLKELKEPKSPAFLKEVNKVFGTKLKMEDFSKSASLRKADASEYAKQLHGVGKHHDVTFLEEECDDDPKVEIVLKLLVRMKKDIKEHGEQAIKDFRKDYLKQTGGGEFDTVLREAIARVYTEIADRHGLRDEADAYWN